MSLIKRLSEHHGIKNVWFFNGSVCGKVGDKRMKFDITDNIDNKVKKSNAINRVCAAENIFHFKFIVIIQTSGLESSCKPSSWTPIHVHKFGNKAGSLLLYFLVE